MFDGKASDVRITYLPLDKQMPLFTGSQKNRQAFVEFPSCAGFLGAARDVLDNILSLGFNCKPFGQGIYHGPVTPASHVDTMRGMSKISL